MALFFGLPLLVLAVLVILAVFALVSLFDRRRNSAPPGVAAPRATPAELATMVRDRQDRYCEERRRILQMVSDGKISGEEAERLLATLERETTTRACPNCGGDIHVSAVKCRHCRQFLVTSPTPPRRLTRSHDRMFSGVCGGLAAYGNLDPSLVRILAVVLVVATGILPGLLVYLVMALVLPPAPHKVTVELPQMGARYTWKCTRSATGVERQEAAGTVP